MKLIEPSMEYDTQIQAFRQEFLAFGASMDGCGSLRRFERTQDWIDQVEMLKAVLPECKALGIGKVLITCITGNEGSRKTILYNGGVYESTVYEPKEKVYLERYWIGLSTEPDDTGT